MATVLRAKTAGFCMGVGLALRKLDQALKEHRARSSGRLVMLGPIIHNPQVMNTYMQQGVVLAHSLDAVQPGDTVIIRAHGVPREDEARLLDLGAHVLDATCPKVKQAQLAIDTADAILFVTDIRSGVTAQDQDIAAMLMRSGKPVFLVVNKVDGVGEPPMELYDFYSLGIGEPYPVSSVHGHGTGDLLDACLQFFPPEDDEEEDEDVIKVAIIGKPNVGKSSLTNRILGTERMIVSNVAGTTRDAIDSYFENEQGKYVFIDTAGMRKKSKVDDVIERYSVLRATMAIDRADVCLIMIDAQEGVTEQDTKVAGLAHEAGKACIIVVNKWDLVEKDGKTMDKMSDDIRRDLSYMTYAPILFISAATGQRVPRLFEMINYVHNQSCMRISTGMLNNILADAQTRVQPPTDRGRRLKIYYMTQVGVCPPHFVVFCNERKLFHFSYQRYLENCIRNVFGLEGTPVIMSIREKGDKED